MRKGTLTSVQLGAALHDSLAAWMDGSDHEKLSPVACFALISVI